LHWGVGGVASSEMERGRPCGFVEGDEAKKVSALVEEKAT
jgi:hypothetical protein